jgi:iron complex transport system substrate-binding protein
MESRLGFILIVFLLSSCVQHNNEDEELSIQDLPHKQLEVKYAKGFTISYYAQYTKILTRSIQGNTFFEDSVFIIHDKSYKLSPEQKTLPAELSSICCQSSTHLAFLDNLSKIQYVKGLCGMSYIENSPVKNELDKNGAIEICIGDAIQTESILSLSPDLYFIYPFASEEVSKLHKEGVKTFMIAEYLEEHPIARLEWVKLFGILLNKVDEAESYFIEVEDEYFNLVKEEVDTNKRFFMNLPYGDTWYSPSSNSLVVKLLEDAGMSYYYYDEFGTENTPHTQEEMWMTGNEANYWVIIADRPEDFSLADLVAENEVYSTFKSVKYQQVIFCNTRNSDYFVKGVLEPHVMLKDLLFATHQFGDYQPRYFHLLK